MPVIAENKEARFRYEILETFEAGIQLTGQEVKSAKIGRASLKGSFVTFHPSARSGQAEAYLTNTTIPPWQPKNAGPNYDPTKARKLLLHRHELLKLFGERTQRGLTIVPLKMYTKAGKVKLEIALVKPLKKWDQREKIKRKEAQRDIARTLKEG